MKRILFGLSLFVAAFTATGCADVDPEDEDLGEAVSELKLPQECSKTLPFKVGGAARLTGLQFFGGKLSSATGFIKNPYGGGNKARLYVNGKQVGSGSGLPGDDEFAIETELTKLKKGDKIEMSFSFNHIGADSKCVVKTTY